MPRQQQTEDIVFEDLHGDAEADDSTVEVDLDGEDGGSITHKARTSTEDGEPTGGNDGASIDYGDTSGDDDADDGGEPGEGDRGDDRFSKKFEKRLDREQRAKRRERDRADTAEADNARLRKQLAKKRGSSNEDKGRDLDRQIDQLEVDLTEAIEKGDTKSHVRLNGQLTDLKAEKIALKYVPEDDDDDGLDDSPATPPRNNLADEWMDDHSDWYGKKGFLRQTRLANRLDKEVHADGFRPSDEDYFEELDNRLREAAPELFDDDGDPAPPPRKTQRQRRDGKPRSPVASADDASRNSNPRTNPNKVDLGPIEFANMRRFGLDPNNKDHLKEYALNKRQTDAEERQRAG